MSIYNHSKILIAIISILFAILLGAASAYQAELTLIFIGAILYAVAIVYLANEASFKRVVPLLFVLILFQDLLMNNFKAINPTLGTVFSYVDEGFLAVALPALIVQFTRGKKMVGKSVAITLLGIFILGLISSLINEVPAAIVLQGAFLMTKGFLYLFIFANIHFSEQDIKKYIKVFKISAIIVLIFAVIDLLMPALFRSLIHTTGRIEYRFGVASVKSLFNTPIVYGWFMVFASMYALTKFKVDGGKKYLLFTMVFIFASLLSFRFKTTISILVIFLFFYLLYGSRKVLAYMLPVALFGLLLFFISGDYFINFIQFTLERYANADWNDTARTALYYISTVVANSQFPFGAGFGRYGGFIAAQEYSPIYYQYGLHHIYGLHPDNPNFATDTYWPNIIGEIGYIGAILLAVFLVFTVVRLFKGYTKVENKTMQGIILFASFVLIQALVESLASPVFNSPPRNVIIFALVGIALSCLNKNRASKVDKEKLAA